VDAVDFVDVVDLVDVHYVHRVHKVHYFAKNEKHRISGALGGSNNREFLIRQA
jgi:hypothetical protein